MAMTPKSWSINALATEFRLDRRTVASRIADIPPAGKLRGADAWRLADVAAAILGMEGAPAADSELSAARARLATEQADTVAMKNAVARRDLLPRADVHMAVTGAFARVRSKLLALPSKVTPVLLGLSSAAQINQALTSAVHEALHELASTQVVGSVEPIDQDQEAAR